MSAADAWQRVGDGAPDRVVLAVDYDSTARAEARFHDLAGLLRPSREMWLTAQPDEAETGMLSPREYLEWWGGRPTGGRVVAVTGFCVGCAWVPAVADAVAAVQGSRPAMLLLDPEPMVVSSLLRDFRTVVDSMTSLDGAERDAYVDEVRAVCASTDDVTVAGGQVVKVYEAAAGVAFDRIGFDEETTDDIVGVFRSYVSYLAAAWQMDPEAGWAAGSALTSAGSSPGAPCARSEQSFPVASADLLADERVAAAVDRFLDEHAT